MSSGNYVPALGYDLLTPFYDRVVGLTARESAFKSALVDQANLEPSDRVLDLATRLLVNEGREYDGFRYLILTQLEKAFTALARNDDATRVNKLKSKCNAKRSSFCYEFCSGLSALCE